MHIPGSDMLPHLAHRSFITRSTDISSVESLRSRTTKTPLPLLLLAYCPLHADTLPAAYMLSAAAGWVNVACCCLHAATCWVLNAAATVTPESKWLQQPSKSMKPQAAGKQQAYDPPKPAIADRLSFSKEFSSISRAMRRFADDIAHAKLRADFREPQNKWQAKLQAFA